MDGGKAAKTIVGTKLQVWHGTADRTAGGLTRTDLTKNKRGKVVSRKQSQAGKKAIMRLKQLGYNTEPGKFKLFSRKNKASGKATRKAKKSRKE